MNSSNQKSNQSDWQNPVNSYRYSSAGSYPGQSSNTPLSDDSDFANRSGNQNFTYTNPDYGPSYGYGSPESITGYPNPYYPHPDPDTAYYGYPGTEQNQVFPNPDSQGKTSAQSEPKGRKSKNSKKKKAFSGAKNKKSNKKKKAGRKKKSGKIGSVNPLLSLLWFLLLVMMLIVSVVMPDRAFSNVENRTLASFPALSASSIKDGSFGKSAGEWFSDQFPFRDQLFHLNYLVRKAEGQKLLNNVFLCSGRLIGQSELAEEAVYNQNADAFISLKERTQLPVHLMVTPQASLIQKQYLPADSPAIDENSVLDSIYGRISEDMNADVRNQLLEKKDEYIYYKTDHHWTTKGAGIGAAKLASLSGMDLSLDSFDYYPVSSTFTGTLAKKTGSVGIEDDIDIAVSKENPEYYVTWADGSKSASIYDKDALDTKDQYQLFLGANQALVTIKTPNTTGRNLLLIKDSYANSMIQYLLPYYDSIFVVDPRYYYDDIDSLIMLNKITEIAGVFCYDTFVTEKSISAALSASTADQLADGESAAETDTLDGSDVGNQ